MKSLGPILRNYHQQRDVTGYGYGAKIKDSKKNINFFALNGNMYNNLLDGYDGAVNAYMSMCSKVVPVVKIDFSSIIEYVENFCITLRQSTHKDF